MMGTMLKYQNSNNSQIIAILSGLIIYQWCSHLTINYKYCYKYSNCLWQDSIFALGALSVHEYNVTDVQVEVGVCDLWVLI